MRVLLADDRPEVRSALRLLIEHESRDWKVVGDAGDAASLHSQVSDLLPDVVLLDWELTGLHSDPAGCKAAQVIGCLHSEAPSTKVIVLSCRAEARAEAIDAGAYAFVSKCDPADGLLAVLAEAAQTPLLS